MTTKQISDILSENKDSLKKHTDCFAPRFKSFLVTILLIKIEDLYLHSKIKSRGKNLDGQTASWKQRDG